MPQFVEAPLFGGGSKRVYKLRGCGSYAGITVFDLPGVRRELAPELERWVRYAPERAPSCTGCPASLFNDQFCARPSCRRRA